MAKKRKKRLQVAVLKYKINDNDWLNCKRLYMCVISGILGGERCQPGGESLWGQGESRYTKNCKIKHLRCISGIFDFSSWVGAPPRNSPPPLYTPLILSGVVICDSTFLFLFVFQARFIFYFFFGISMSRCRAICLFQAFRYWTKAHRIYNCRFSISRHQEINSKPFNGNGDEFQML